MGEGVLTMKDTDLVVKSNTLVSSRYRLDWSEHRIVLFLISKIDKDDEDFKEYIISVANMAKLMGLTDSDKQLGGGFYHRVEQAIQSLMSRVLTVREGKDWLKFHWVSSAKYLHKKGQIRIKISPELKPYLLQVKKNFTSYELGNVIKMKSIYSARLYELLKQYEKIGKRKFEISELRNFLEIEPTEYVKIDHFHKRVIKPAHEELPQKSDICFEYEFIKTGRRFTHIEFTIKPQARKGRGEDEIEIMVEVAQSYAEVAATISPDEEDELFPQAAVIDILSKEALIEQLRALGITKKMAKTLTDDFDQDRIISNIKYAEKAAKSGEIKKISAFGVEAIRQDYAHSQMSLFEQEQLKQSEVEKRKKAEQIAEIERRKQTGSALEVEYNKLVDGIIRGFIEEIENSEEASNAFDEWFNSLSSPFIKKHYNRLIQMNDTDEGRDKAKLYIFNYYYGQLERKMITFEEFAAEKGYKAIKELDYWLVW